MMARTSVGTDLLVAALLSLLMAASLGAQEARTVADAADEFQRAMLGMSWLATADRMHADALADFREHVSILMEADGSGVFSARILAGRSRAEVAELSDAELFIAVMNALEREAPGLINSLVARTYEVLGSVPEGADRAHVVYRVAPSLPGDEPRVEVMTVAQGPRGWRVLRSNQLDALITGLRGLPIGRTPPPPARDTVRSGLSW